MTTPLYPAVEKRVNDAIEQLINNQVTPWLFMTAGPPFRIKKFDGTEIAYERIEFNGSPKEVLGRHKVCALKKGDIELPTDYDGVLYKTLDEAGDLPLD